MPPHFLLIKISTRRAMIFRWGFAALTRPWETRQGASENFSLRVGVSSDRREMRRESERGGRQMNRARERG